MNESDGQSSPLRPSFFELLATEQLGNSLRPALQFALEVLSPRHRILLWLSHNADEVYLTLSTALELASLRRDASLICESFYSLRRAKNYYSNDTVLPPRTILSSLFWCVALPYIRIKLDATHTSLRETPTTTSAFHRGGIPLGIPRMVRILLALQRVLLSQNTRDLYLRLYPVCMGIADTASLLCKTAYLLELSPYFSPTQVIQRLVLRRLTPKEAMGPTLPPAKTGLQRALRVSDGFATGVKYAAFAALVAYRFLEYYHQAEDEVPTIQAPVPPPPQPLRAVGKIPDSADECPLCEKRRVHPAALSKSGFVFCYECILKYVREFGRCPVTNISVERAHICRVYHAEA